MPQLGMMISDQRGKKKEFVDKVVANTETNKKVYNFNYQRKFQISFPLYRVTKRALNLNQSSKILL